jgi:2-amino-4-hydroxy-6-hydroxymethyldihydropteridine diphosphokinase
VSQVLLALGSNVGDRLAHLTEAVELLNSRIDVKQTSRVYETAPMYVTDQRAFLNAALSGETKLGPLHLLRVLKGIEAEMGRRNRRRFGPREIDIDLIAYGSMRYRYVEAGQTILETPHPRVAERRFVLAPLADVAPEFILPGIGRVRELLERTEEQSDCVRKVDGVLPVHGHG